MMSNHLLDCGDESRRHTLLSSECWNGIDYVEVADDQLSLCVYFFAAAPTNLTPRNIRIDGGRRIRGIKVTNVTPGPQDEERGADCLCVTLDQYGDFSTYTLRLVEATTEAPLHGIDPRYAQIEFNFKVACTGDFDCAAAQPCPQEIPAAPDIDYLAKDYESFRQLLLDRLATTMPDWRERHVPDLGVTLVELLAYTADQLSAYQDAVATEAYLDTSRTRISVRRHARLVDYRLHEGCNARAWLAIGCDGEEPIHLPGDAYFITAHADIAAIAHGNSCKESDLQFIAESSYEVFEQALAAVDGSYLFGPHSTLRFHTWGDQECCLRKGATRATLRAPVPPPPPPQGSETSNANTPRAAATVDTRRANKASVADNAPVQTQLKSGDVLIFEEVLGPVTGNRADADPTHRQAVRLTQVTYTRDELLDVAIIEIVWAPADALTFTLCLSARLSAPDCRRISDVCVARGNVILVDHGRWLRGESLDCVGIETVEGACGCEGAITESVEHPAHYAPSLSRAPLIYSEVPPGAGAASIALDQDPHQALPRIAIGAVVAGAAQSVETWDARADLLDSAADACDVVVETDDDGRAHLRFGDGRCGRQPTPGSCFQADYRIGVALAGNIAREAIEYVVFRTETDSGGNLRPRNPLPARGGIAPESLVSAKLAAPHAFRARLERAITADDYAQLAEEDADLQRANARLTWTGSWYEADVAIDPLGAEESGSALCRRIDRRLECFRRAGHDLAVVPARYVPLAITLHVCVMPDYLSAQVAAAVLDVLVSGRRTDGKLAFFHPDNLSFGTDVYASDLIAAAHAVEGVQNVELIELRRMADVAGAAAPESLDMATWEIAQLDNDPDFPERGVLKLQVGGGR
ncbi:MAG: putative baseplate assembly protein [Dokdonella sp.]